ncbi:MAG: TIGR04290 family methyltransferase [Verrucomicrobia bacterium]|nr:TIGR04290 family methyltransferase [Verrucomicrobiota bacterium]MBV8532456.1 TIGR04290 family methyltransferase [Verrucomicrobiota bacterium]
MRHQQTIEWQVQSLGEWFQNFEIGDIKTAPNHPLGDYPRVKWDRFRWAIPENLKGKCVLEVGCNAGFYAFEMKKRGADRVLGIDTDPHYLRQAEFMRSLLKLDVEFRRLSVYEVKELHEEFDLVLFLGVLYHLRYPLLALDLLRRHATRDLFIVQSMIRGGTGVEPVEEDYSFWETEIFSRPEFPRLHFVEARYAADPTNWWIPNRACLEAMIRAAGFRILLHPEQEVYVCQVTDMEARGDDRSSHLLE